MSIVQISMTSSASINSFSSAVQGLLRQTPRCCWWTGLWGAFRRALVSSHCVCYIPLHGYGAVHGCIISVWPVHYTVTGLVKASSSVKQAALSCAGAGGGAGGGQTREHAQLARSLGIEQLAVVVSKLDTCGFSQACVALTCPSRCSPCSCLHNAESACNRSMTVQGKCHSVVNQPGTVPIQCTMLRCDQWHGLLEGRNRPFFSHGSHCSNFDQRCEMAAGSL